MQLQSPIDQNFFRYELDLVDRFGGCVLQDIIKSAIAAKVKQSKPTFSSISNLTYLTEVRQPVVISGWQDIEFEQFL